MPEHGIRSTADTPLPFHPLVYLEDGDEVTIGRPDTDSYGIFPPDGAHLVRRLAEGATPAQASDWYAAEYGEQVDVEDIIGALRELGFVREADEDPAAAEPVRWQRLGRALFSPLAWVCYALVVAWALLRMILSPDLVPTAEDLLFSDYYAVVSLVLLVAAVPLIAVHEAFHALAARRLGVRSRTRLSYRFYFLVVETALDGLVAVERRKRYLPIVAGMVADCVLLGLLITVADASRGPGGAETVTSRVCLGLAFAALLRLLWQFFLYLRTDVYVLITTMLGCVDLHTTSVRLLRNRFLRLRGRTDKLADESQWHPVDRRAAGWYSWLIVAGYTVSLGTFVLALAPVLVQMVSGAIDRFGAGQQSSWTELLDSSAFLFLTFAQIALTVWIAARERVRARRSRTHHVID
ncbi:hypothetical protein KPP03845_100511 [Streptomyces xanthophaeus]|uniref:hypothetical protein n=1 Tax=Streptomyces xanthophaeus TaxID=67385 RepID=UPI00233E7BDE|nr:hypothetical protein [Streptomyces xanthophaeus]WCD84191.1 hypothetical protein KPP03845_100511 [Streptomyces xanthophaeus]